MLARLFSNWRRRAARADRVRAAKLGQAGGAEWRAQRDAKTAQLRREVGLPPIGGATS